MGNPDRRLIGIAVSEGVAFGNAYLYRPQPQAVTLSGSAGGDAAQRYVQSLAIAAQQLSAISGKMTAASDSSAKIFEAQQEILADEEMDACVRELIEDEQLDPAAAVEQVYEQFAAILAKVKDPLIAARAADIRDVKTRVLRVLCGACVPDLSALPFGTVLVAHDLLPSDTAQLDPSRIAAIVTELGNQTTHTAILSHSLGIPAILGVKGAMEAIAQGIPLVVDALAGEIICQPDEAVRRQLEAKRERFADERRIQQTYLHRDAVTTDGVRIQIGINIGGSETDFSSCDYCGLFRTEFLFLNRQELPDEQTQFMQYCKVLENAGGRLVTLRTLDIGGDKTVPCLPLPKEANPFLGRRALRLCLADEALFRTQLRAVLRASAFGRMQIMYPMVGSLTDFRRARAITRRVMADLDAEGVAYNRDIPLGIMIEIPSIAQIADLVAAEVDFASVGTNDLCQYLCAADRLNPDVAENYESYGPAMLRCLHNICQAFDAAGKPISICGELAGERDAVALLVGMGYRKLSMTAQRHAAVKSDICSFSVQQAQALLARALQCGTQQEILDLIHTRRNICAV